MSKRLICIGAAFVAAAVVIVACSDSKGPTAPSSAPSFSSSPEPVTTTPSPPPASPTSGATEDPEADSANGLNARWTIGDTKITVRVRNLTDSDQPVVFACYRAPRGVNEIGDQVLDSSETVDVEAGEETRITLDLPACEWQCDVANRSTPREPPYYTPRELIGFRDSIQVGLDLPRECAPPPPPPPPPTCDPEELREQAGEQCEYGIKSLDLQACSFECNPPPVCDLEQLEKDAKAECGELGYEIDEEACSFTCNSDPCEGVAFGPGSLTVENLEACADVNVEPGTASWSLNWGGGVPGSANGDGDASDVCNTYPKAGTWQAFLSIFAPGPEGEKCGERPFQVTTECPKNTIEQQDGTCKPICDPPGVNLRGLTTNNSCVPYCEVYPEAEVCQPKTCEELVPLPNEGTYSLPNSSRECQFFGDFEQVEKEESWPWDLEDGDFYICKAGQDWEVTYDKPSRLGFKCSNGKTRSHITVCRRDCPEDD